MPHPGLVFQLTSEGGNHFWVVISPVVNGLVLAVNITDFLNCPDSPCVFEAGVHEVITKRSVAYYRKAREFEACKIDQLLEAGQYLRRLKDFPPELLHHLVAGATKADDLTFRFRKYLAVVADGEPPG